jgi:hypothetical protein
LANVNDTHGASGTGGRQRVAHAPFLPASARARYAHARVAAGLASLAVAGALAAAPAMPAQAYANGHATIAAERVAQAKGLGQAAPDGPDSTFDISGLLLPLIGVLSLIARRRLAQRQR